MAATPESWNVLLDWLTAFPRENGTEALGATARTLQETLANSGVKAEAAAWTAHPWRLRLVGLGTLVGMLAYAALLRQRRRWAAAAIALLLPAWLLLELDLGVTLVGRVYPVDQTHVVATVPARVPPARERLVLSAHYDSKTDALDHIARAPFTLLAFPATLVTLLVPLIGALWRRRWLVHGAQLFAVLHGVGLFVSQTAGAFVSRRSPGATDDGAACAVLVQVARALHADPLRHTDVELVFFSGEELGIEGSRAWIGARFANGTRIPTRAINLDPIGGSADFVVYRAEQAVLRRLAPDPALVAVVDAAHRAQRGKPLHRPPYPVLTDARAFLEAGIPALNLGSDLPGHALPRGLHSADDDRDRVSIAALDATLDLLLGTARALDAEAASPAR